jgi:hypothetical protein
MNKQNITKKPVQASRSVLPINEKELLELIKKIPSSQLKNILKSKLNSKDMKNDQKRVDTNKQKEKRT